MSALLNVGPAQIFPLTVDQYHAMIDNGILTSDDRVELLDGVLVQKALHNHPHRISTRATRQALERLIPKGSYVDEQKPLTLATSEPEPDVAVIRGDTRDYPNRHPGPQEVGIVIEISDASLERDRGFKKRIYAAGEIASCWIVDLGRNKVEVYTEPQTGDYKRCDVFEPHQQIRVTLDGQSIDSIPVSDLLP
ncbi:MAG TPA: Uma2 family endonuclease [Bryobacteraceae bacterium]|nr:Uma2 family endonuclease [Bryobacteraceae bacterium]